MSTFNQHFATGSRGPATPSVSSKENDRDTIKKSIAAFVRRGGKAEKLPGPEFKPRPLYRRNLNEPSFLHPRQQDRYYRQQLIKENNAAKDARAKLKTLFQALDQADVNNVIQLAGTMTVIQIANRTKFPRKVVQAILFYHNVVPPTRAAGYLHRNASHVCKMEA